MCRLFTSSVTSARRSAPNSDPPHQDCVIERSLLMGSDYYEQFDECEIYADCLPIGVGRGTHVSGGRGGPGEGGGAHWRQPRHGHWRGTRALYEG